MKTKFYFILILFLNFSSLNAQQLNVDSLYQSAQTQAGDGNYDGALNTLQELIGKYPQNFDYKIFKGRIYSWKGEYGKALDILRPIADTTPILLDAIEAIVNTYFWSGNYNEVIRYSAIALSKDSSLLFYQLKKAEALVNLKRDKEALQVIDTILSKDDKQETARSLQTYIYRRRPNSVSFSYLNTSFSNPGFAPWHLASIEYLRNLKTPVAARVNYSNLFNQQATQFEADLYPKVGKGYLYFNTGIAGGDLFPVYKVGIEYYTTFLKPIMMSSSFGARYLHFKTDRVFILTGHVAFYLFSWQLGYRPFITLIDQKSYTSHTLSIKKENFEKERFIQFDFQYGTAPYVFFISNDFTRISSKRVGVQYQFRIGKNLLIKPIFMYEYEEYVPEKFRNRYNTQLIITKRF